MTKIKQMKQKKSKKKIQIWRYLNKGKSKKEVYMINPFLTIKNRIKINNYNLLWLILCRVDGEHIIIYVFDINIEF